MGKGKASSAGCKIVSIPYYHAQNASNNCIGTPFPVSLLCLTGRELMILVAVICVTLGMYRTQSMGLISACDIRISASSASFAIKHTDIGHSLSVQLLQKLVGSSSWICDVAFSGREFDASEASRVGFVTRVVEGDDDALRESVKLAEIIAARSPSFLQKLKQELWRIRKLRASKHLLFCVTFRDSSKPGLKSIQASNQQGNTLTTILRLNWRMILIRLWEWTHRSGLAGILRLRWPPTLMKPTE